MSMKNRYCKRSRISEKKFREIVKLFCLDLEATKIAKLIGLSPQSINKYLGGIREKVVELYVDDKSWFVGDAKALFTT